MEDNKKDVPESPMMSEEGKQELYMYSVLKMAKENSDSMRIPLTGLYGLKPFLFNANELMKNSFGSKFAVIRMDIYRFKTVNEFCGRKAGDALLKYIADTFREFESDDTIVGHLRADIFAMCVSYEDTQNLIDIVSYIKNKIDKYNISCKILPAFGICISKDGMDVSLMLDYADIAMQEIKGKAFKFYTFYDDNMRKNMLYEKKIENEILGAIESDYIKTYVQPKVDMRSGKIVGGEALVRWLHPADGFIYPDKFIPVLEKSGYILDVDKHIWKSICMFLGSRKENNKPIVPISVNVSRMHVYHGTFTKYLCRLVEKFNISPEYIPLEVTESAFTEKEWDLYKKMHYLQRKGFRVSMDDFGSGYSSLNMLKDENVDEVKIDKKFIDTINDNNSRIVIRHVISMLRELGIDIIVEGVETKEQADFLMENGCFYAQGYLYYKPMPIDEFGELLEKQQK